MKKKIVSNSDINKALLKNTGIIAIGQISIKIINFLLLPLYTGLLTSEEYGLIDLLSTYGNFIMVIVGLQMSQAVFRFLVTCREDEEKKIKIISTIMISITCSSVIYMLIFRAFELLFKIKYGWFLVTYVIASVFLQTVSGVVRGLGRNVDYTMGNFIASFVTLVLNILFVAVLHYSVNIILLSYIIGPVVGCLFQIIRTKLYYYINIRKLSKDELKLFINYSVPLIPNELSWAIIHVSDRMIISAFLSVAANGLIAVASKFSVIYTTMFSIFNMSWTEQVVLHYKDDGGPQYISRMFEKIIIFFGCIAIGIIACMPFIFKILVHQQFSGSYNLIPLYMVAVFFNAVIGMISAIYLIENETKQVAISTSIAAIINLIVDIALVRYIGVYAAPISSIFAYVFISVWRFIDINRRHCTIQISRTKTLLLFICLLVSLLGFYTTIWIYSFIALLFVMILSIILNKDFFRELYETFKIDVNRRKKRK